MPYIPPIPQLFDIVRAFPCCREYTFLGLP